MSKKTVWHKVLDNKNELPEGRVMRKLDEESRFILSISQAAQKRLKYQDLAK